MNLSKLDYFFHLLNEKNRFPVPNSTFDKVYAESIIAIQEDEDLIELLLEIKRVLKPNGVLLFNETIWSDTSNKSRAQKINSASKKAFGIIQSSHDYLRTTDWINLLTALGFKLELKMRVADIPSMKSKFFMPTLYSKIFTMIGKTRTSSSVSLRRDWKNFQSKMDAIIKPQEKLMEGIIFKAYINK